MANPQRENGHIDIANEIVEAMARTNLSAYQSRVLWALWRKTWGWHKKEDWISNSQFVEMTGIAKGHIARAVKELALRNIVTRSGNKISFHKDYTQWRELPHGVRVYRSVTQMGNVVTPSGNEVTPLGVHKRNSSKETLQKKRSVDPAVLSLFNSFYQAYPKHEDRQGALKAFLKVNPQNGQFETILQAIEKRKDYNAYLRRQDPKAFIPEWPLPSTWLNRKRWEDEIPEVKSSW